MSESKVTAPDTLRAEAEAASPHGEITNAFGQSWIDGYLAGHAAGEAKGYVKGWRAGVAVHDKHCRESCCDVDPDAPPEFHVSNVLKPTMNRKGTP